MLRLDSPSNTYDSIISGCIEGITGNILLRTRLQEGRGALLAARDNYICRSVIGELHKISPVPDDLQDPVVVDIRKAEVLKKSDLIKIYEKYFAAKGKPARKFYDDLLLSALERCPFCGGIGRPRTLDHFLPKARFPLFSILPQNLVPSCRDCNFDGKSQSYATCPEDQLIQPYIDVEKFFKEQWVFAEFSGCFRDPQSELNYFVRAPDGWSVKDEKRARKHFDAFDLSSRYAFKAAEQRGTVVRQIDGMKKAGMSCQSIKDILIKPGINEAVFPNHWQVGMYQAFFNAIN
ncbi:HNH endonuclease [Xanthomonas oryzae]|uniref:HNH endonuclease n=1 Tax=Xanthomonas oryzae TaxID=347 RepID=UPI003DA0E3C2